VDCADNIKGTNSLSRQANSFVNIDTDAQQPLSQPVDLAVSNLGQE